MAIGEIKTAVELLEKTGMPPATIAGCVIALVTIMILVAVMVKMCRVMIGIGRLLIKWDKAQEVDRVTYRAEFKAVHEKNKDQDKLIEDHGEKIHGCISRINVLEKFTG